MSLPVPPEITAGQIALDPVNGIVYYKDSEDNLVSTTWSWLRDDISNVSTNDDVLVDSDLTVSGNLIVNGDTVSINVSQILVEDNFLVLNSNVTSSPTLNAGIEVERGSSSNVSIRWNESSDIWEFTTDGTTFKEINGTATESLSWSSPITLNLSGDLTGSVSFDGSENITLTATVVNDSHNHTASSLTFALEDASDVSISGLVNGDFLRYNGSNWINDPVNLTTDTVGDYVAKLAAGTGITITNNSGEGATPNVSFSGSINDLSDLTITSAQNGQILEYDGTAWVNTVRPSSEPIGHENKADSVISFDEGSRQFSIAPASTSYTVWCAGKRYVKTTTESVTIPDTSGLYYIYFNSSGSLAYKTTFFTWDQDTPTAYIYWNENDNKAYFFADERHGVTLDWATHEYLHRTRGAAIANGFGANNYTLIGNGSLDSHAQMDIANGTFFDEDLQVDIEHASLPTTNTWQQRLQSGAYIPVFYRLNTHWTKDVATQFPVKNGGTRAQFNLNTAGTWSSTAIDNSKYGVMFVVATNNLNEPIISIMGQSQYTNQGSAEASAWDELDLAGFPIVEFRPLYKIVFQTATAYANSPKTRFVNLIDLRTVLPSGDGLLSVPVSDHGNMTGLSDDDHTQYLTEARHDAHDHSSAMSSVVLNDIYNVNAATPSSSQVLTYNGSEWVASTATATVSALDNVGDVTAPSPSSGDYLQWDGTAWINNSINVDNLNDVSISGAYPNSGDYLKWGGTFWTNGQISLGTDTTGNYLSDVTAGTGVSITHTPGEGSSAEVAIGQNVGLTDTPSFYGLTLTSTAVLQQSLEKVTSSITANGTTNIDLLESALFQCTSTGNFTFNFRGNSSTTLNSIMSTNQSITTVLFVANTTARSLSGINIDGSAQTIKWFGGSAPTGNASATDVYTITIIKTGSAAYTVYASQSKFA